MSCWSEINLNEIIIVNLPLSKELLTKLLKLDLTNYKKHSSLPSVICNLTSLNALTLSCCSKLDKMLENFKNLEDLKELDRRGNCNKRATFIDSSLKKSQNTFFVGM